MGDNKEPISTKRWKNIPTSKCRIPFAVIRSFCNPVITTDPIEIEWTKIQLYFSFFAAKYFKKSSENCENFLVFS